MRTYVIVGMIFAGMVTPALAAEYYVAQNLSSHKCSIVTHKPDGKSMTMLGSEAFPTKAGAQQAMKTMTGCKA